MTSFLLWVAFVSALVALVAVCAAKNWPAVAGWLTAGVWIALFMSKIGG